MCVFTSQVPYESAKEISGISSAFHWKSWSVRICQIQFSVFTWGEKKWNNGICTSARGAIGWIRGLTDSKNQKKTKYLPCFFGDTKPESSLNLSQETHSLGGQILWNAWCGSSEDSQRDGMVIRSNLQNVKRVLFVSYLQFSYKDSQLQTTHVRINIKFTLTGESHWLIASIAGSFWGPLKINLLRRQGSSPVSPQDAECRRI